MNDKEKRDRENGCQACHFESKNIKKSREPHTCGKDIIEAREIYHDTFNHNNMCRQPNTPLEYKHAELMRELNEFSIAIKLHLHPDKFGDSFQEIQKRYAKPDMDYIDSLHRRIREVLQQDAKPFVKYKQGPEPVKQGSHPGIKY